MKIIGITGNIASGKSTISKIIAKHYNLPLISVDDFSKNWINLYSVGGGLMLKKAGMTEYNNIQQAIRDNIFKNPELKSGLERVISDYFWEYIKEIRLFDVAPVILIEHPLMFELHQEMRFDFIIGIDTLQSIRIDRMIKRGYDPSTIEELLNNQISFYKNKDRVDLLINNSTPLTSEEIIYECEYSSRFKTLISEISVL